MQLRYSRIRSKRSQSGIALLEASLGIAGLVMLAFVLLLLSIRAIQAQRWTVMQTFTDAYMTQEVALGKRLQFSALTDDGSPWPVSPRRDSEEVTIGVLPNGKAVTATLWRTRIPEDNNLASAGGAGTDATNPISMETWKLQSYLVYEVDDRPYVKTRTVIRTR